MGYDYDRRSREMQESARQKWKCRKEGKLLNPGYEERDNHPSNLCKNQPKSLIKYIHMQRALCKLCKECNLIIRCNKEHLEHYHGIEINDRHEIVDLMEDEVKRNKMKRKKWKQSAPRQRRKEIMEFSEKSFS